MRRVLLAILTVIATATLVLVPPATRARAAGIDTLVGAGDIAQGNTTGDTQTAALLGQLLVESPGARIFTAGDNINTTGRASDYERYFTPTWGGYKSKIRPAEGNHDYRYANSGYYAYFGAAAGPSNRGWYSYDLPGSGWHVVVLNSNLSTSKGSAQETWLKADLAANPVPCTLAIWHQPRWSSGQHGSNAKFDPFVQDLYAAGAELVVSGHDHEYERFAPQTPTGGRDDSRGIRQFVVGTGGAATRGFGTIRPNSQVRKSGVWGVLRLSLSPSSYQWNFMPVAGKTWTDSGSTTCH